MSVGVMEDYKLRDLRASHTGLVGRGKKTSIWQLGTFFFPSLEEETSSSSEDGSSRLQHLSEEKLLFKPVLLCAPL
jgi:hypothetical protein